MHWAKNGLKAQNHEPMIKEPKRNSESSIREGGHMTASRRKKGVIQTAKRQLVVLRKVKKNCEPQPPASSTVANKLQAPATPRLVYVSSSQTFSQYMDGVSGSPRAPANAWSSAVPSRRKPLIRCS